MYTLNGLFARLAPPSSVAVSPWSEVASRGVVLIDLVWGTPRHQSREPTSLECIICIGIRNRPPLSETLVASRVSQIRQVCLVPGADLSKAIACKTTRRMLAMQILLRCFYDGFLTKWLTSHLFDLRNEAEQKNFCLYL
ncbi:hypothetical protein ACMV5I_12690 [Serratia sp. T13T92]|jgi:hypothetical protein|uniref:hypothetical protein n=1 Tax=Serratia sp. T13T92 TaxID=3397496 RepID=UPI0039E114AA